MGDRLELGGVDDVTALDWLLQWFRSWSKSRNKMLVLIVSSFGWFLVLPSRNCRVGIFLSWQSCCLISIPSFSLPGPPLSCFLRASYFSRVLDLLKMQYWLSRSVWGPRACSPAALLLVDGGRSLSRAAPDDEQQWDISSLLRLVLWALALGLCVRQPQVPSLYLRLWINTSYGHSWFP